MTGPGRRRSPASRATALAVLAVAVLALLVWALWPLPAGEGDPAAPDSGLPPCDPGAVPPQVEEVVADIEAGGPYDYPRNDAMTFHNREGLLPEETSGYYREFTVETPGVDHRGARRIVTGGPEETDPDAWYFTDDHYESFCELPVP